MKSLNDWTLTRRQALAAFGAMAATAPFLSASAQEKSGPKIAIQLYTMRDPAKKDLAGTLKQVREMGWEYVQWSGMPDLPAEKIKEALDTAGLKAMACHCGVEAFETDFENQVKFWKTVGVQYVGPGGMMGDCKDSLEAWIRGAKRLDAVGAKLREAGLFLTYHNHSGEFETYPNDPRTKEDILIAETTPGNLFVELDVAWVKAANVDPAAYIRKCKGRCLTIHAKDLAMEPKNGKVIFAPLGKGILNWPDVFAACKETGVEWYIYEQDTCLEGPFKAAEISLAFLKSQVA